MKMVFVSGGNGKEDAPSQGGCGGNGKDPTIVYYDATYKTNADRIRAMTDEELAEWIYQVQDGDAYQKENYLPPLSKSWWLKWLKREANHA